MPGWHAATRELEEAGRIKVLGIAEEQHGERTALFLQWQRIDWPVLLDSCNLLGVSAVPITVFVDEFGIIRARNPKPEQLSEFVEAEFAPPQADDGEAGRMDPPLPPDVIADDPAAISAWLDEWGAPDSAPNAFSSPEWQFRIGVLHRKRHDHSPFRRTDDFDAAVAHWRKALSLNPNQYIWRRRIQQYGPRLDKPYPFYDWVPKAQAEVAARGERPHPLNVEPTGAEIAAPDRTRVPDGGAPEPENPDPDGTLARDDGNILEVAATAVPSTDPDRPGWRIHLTFTPRSSTGAHWNNESGAARFLARPPAGTWTIDPAVVDLAPPSAAAEAATTSKESRRLEFEIVGTGGATQDDTSRPGEFSGSLFFHACDGPDGACRFLRRDITVPLSWSPPP